MKTIRNTDMVQKPRLIKRAVEGDVGDVCCYTENKNFGFAVRCILDQGS